MHYCIHDYHDAIVDVFEHVAKKKKVSLKQVTDGVFLDELEPLVIKVYEELSKRALGLASHKGVLPGMFAALHSFGRDLKLNPHVHISTTRGGLNDKETRFVSFYFKKKVIMKMWRYRVIQLLKKAYNEGVLALPDGLTALCPTFAHFSAWLNRRLNKPWIVHVAKPQKNPQASINYLGRYIRRPPIGHSRLRHYNGQNVTCLSQNWR